ncbi:hypothetical protein CSIV_12495 [Microbacterium sp. CSI-V]|uniref:SMI1/KNR4 family protein n=1 Tax=unclassified Microbacterium TaxID=2609290 RepID=UPI00097C23F3|nr:MULTISPECIES: SMI1/KNR4 family protein [unclassified Microbacterium]MXS73694.1 SMI1/KNR4 family protein [Microbacterium sp. TL13]ONI62328.1 hypothetical protein CSIV_12495 [Microbacterium sp. CSI-V]
MDDLVMEIMTLAQRGEAEMGSGVSEQEISEAESLLGSFPPDFHVYLRTFAWMSIGSSEFFGLGPDVEYPSMLVTQATLHERADGGLPLDMITFLNNGAGDLACFRGHPDTDDVGAVYWFLHETRELEATGRTFTEFVRECIDWVLDESNS